MGIIAMTDQTTTTPGSRAGLARSVRQGNGPSPRDLAAVVAITGQVPSALIGTDGFQEADIAGITLPITKHNFLVTSADDIARTVAEAFHVASTGRPGPVLVDIAKDALQALTTFRWPVPFELPGYRPVTRPHSRQVREA